MAAMTQDKLDPVRIGIVSISDRASTGVYEDKGLPALKDWLTRALKNPSPFDARLIPDEKERISAALIELGDADAAARVPTGIYATRRGYTRVTVVQALPSRARGNYTDVLVQLLGRR